MSDREPISNPDPPELIAIVGSSCRFAGGATSPSRLWELLREPADVSQAVPRNRFHVEAFYHPDGEHEGTTDAPRGYFLEQDHRVFDAGFFGVAPREAEAMDPQQRMLLEGVYEALQAGGYGLGKFGSGGDVAVFAGLMTADYDTVSQRDELGASRYAATGNARSMAANRVSYFFDWRGPSVTVDTACSSSLVALHAAVGSLRAGECEAAVAAGANLMLAPEQSMAESSLHMLSPSGRCRMWDAGADGYARGEGVAVVLLKTMRRALADGDRIEAVVRATGVNSDGRTRGITLPSPEAQAQLVADTYRRAGLNARRPEDRCQYFEAHGTGTQAGDPREAEAIHEAFYGDKNDENGHLLVGSIKTVIGHTEGAAGLAGVLKVVQAMQHGMVPPNLHLDTLNPIVAPFCIRLEVPTQLMPWPSPPEGQPRRASVNSFGFGGTNAHAIIEQYQPEVHGPATPMLTLSSAESASGHLSLPLFLSASSQKSLLAVVKTYRDYLETSESLFSALAYHTYARCTALPYKLAVSGTSAADIKAKLASIDTTQPGTRSRTREGPAKILGIFTGQGAQWAGMGRDLARNSSIYRDTVRSLNVVLHSCPDPPAWSLEEELLGKGTAPLDSALSQPACTALQIGLVDVLRSLGVKLTAVVGHSSGEMASAYAAGFVSARDAILASYYRGRAVHLASGVGGCRGGMLAVGLGKKEAEELCEKMAEGGQLVVGASNAPQSTTLSGDYDAVCRARNELERQGKFARMLRVDKAYHSPHMAASATEYLESMEACGVSSQSSETDTVWVSSVYGSSSSPSPDAVYWRDNMMRPVLFQEAVSAAADECGSFDFAIEIGPHPALKGPTAEILRDATGAAAPPFSALLDRTKPDGLAISEFLGTAWTHLGPYGLDVSAFVASSPWPELAVSRVDDAPPYPWDHSQTFYRESRPSRQYHFRESPPHELLGARTRDDNRHELRWRSLLTLEAAPWIAHHRFQGQPLLPASAYCLMAVDAARAWVGEGCAVVELQDLEFLSGIVVEPDSGGVEVMFSLTVDRTSPSGLPSASFTVTSTPAPETPMKLNAAGRLRVVLGSASPSALPARLPSQAEKLAVSTDTFYDTMASVGLGYTGPFQAIEVMERRLDYATATLRRRHTDDTTSLAASPATLDACFQAAFATLSSPGDGSLWTAFLPRTIDRIRFSMARGEDPDDALHVDAYLTTLKQATRDAPAGFSGDICVSNAAGDTEVQVEGLTVAALAAQRPDDDCELYLTTVLDVDPEDEIVRVEQKGSESTEDADAKLSREIFESCERVAAFYSGATLWPSPPLDHLRQWPGDTAGTVEAFMQASPHEPTLNLVRTVAIHLADLLPAMLPALATEATQLAALRSHIARIARQIAHRYPRMHILGVADSSLGNLTRTLLEGLGSSFLSYTTTSPAEKEAVDAMSMPDSRRSKIFSQELDLDKEDDHRYHLVVIPTTFIQSDPRVLEKLRRTVGSGGFLILIDCPPSLRDRLGRFVAGLQNSPAPQPRAVDWPSILNKCGFPHAPRNSSQTLHPGPSLIVRQAECVKHRMLLPMEDADAEPSRRRLLVVGGIQDDTAKIAAEIGVWFSSHYAEITSIDSLDDDNTDTTSCTAVLLLCDLDGPFLSGMTDTRLVRLKALLRPNMVILWVTRNARVDNPEGAASFGFARTVLAETPGLALRMLDLEGPITTDDTVGTICDELARLVVDNDTTDPDFLWSREAEVHVRDGKRFIPRVLPWAAANNRLNAARRLISESVNTLETPVELLPAHGGSHYKTALTPRPANPLPSGHCVIEVHYSSAIPATTEGPSDSYYVCFGRDIHTRRPLLALSRQNASIVVVPVDFTHGMPASLDANIQHPLIIAFVLRSLAALSMDDAAFTTPIVLVEPDDMLVACVRRAISSSERVFSIYSTDSERCSHDAGLIRLHPSSSARQVKALLPPRARIYDFLPPTNGLSEVLASSDGWIYSYVGDRLFPAPSPQDPAQPGCEAETNILPTAPRFWKPAVHLACQALDDQDVDIVTVPDLVNGNHGSFPVIDWRRERNVPLLVEPLIEEHLMRSDRTYILIGLTRDLGQSLCRLLAEHGAGHIVLASRNPDRAPRWADELARTNRVSVHVESLDVTDLDAVLRFRDHLETLYPPVAGVVNGAMVLDDRVLSQMSLDTLHRVMRPKTVGSRNLDRAFASPDMDFFIMTSSFAAIGGHAGQSNYAAANMYMNGLAASRRHRGLAASVLNMGVVYGLGLLHRERGDLYAGLERDGYPPVSERDIHHMFLEAVVAGRPDNSSVSDITTGLRRFHIDDPNPLHWHRDPRFSHYTAKDDGVPQEKEILQDAVDPADLSAGALAVALARRLEAVLRLPTGSVSSDSSATELGVDSLAAVELRTWLWRAARRDVAVMKILAAPSIAALCAEIAGSGLEEEASSSAVEMVEE